MTLPRRTVLSLMLALAASRSAVATAGEAPSAPKAIRMLVPELPVLGERDAQGQAKGLVVDQARAILDRAGIPAIIEMLPVVRLYAELARPQSLDGLKDGEPKTYGMVGLPIRDPYQGIVPLALTMQVRLVAVARRGVPLTKPDDLRQMGPVAVTNTGTQALASVIQQYALAAQTVPSMLNGLRMLAHGRVDAVLGISSVIDVVARENDLTGELGDRVAVSEMDAWLACAPGLEAAPETSSLRAAAEALYREGRLDAIAHQHFQRAAARS
ncbi:transporter substrate-binding domain-containing protein [Azospirillum sp. B4]|uniref:transporter substrate-binding domain-containing protein n=1 Tax=Azospirillum sp. B4 TaxID=95605 RepID=UPI000344FD42|nr:transporter substrate-binding domain-containing protein [Azospirillum sp. B4]